MTQMLKILGNKKLRSVWDASKKTWWVSVIDVIAAVRNTDYDTARNYWKQMKSRINNKPSGKNHKTNTKISTKISHQIKLTCKDKKQRYTDVMQYKDIIQLIQILPICSVNALSECSTHALSEFKKFIGSLASKTKAMANIFNAACTNNSNKKGSTTLQTITRQNLF